MTILFEDDIMPVGPYKDMPISDIINVAPMYLHRFAKNSHGGKYAISDEVLRNVPRINPQSTIKSSVDGPYIYKTNGIHLYGDLSNRV